MEGPRVRGAAARDAVAGGTDSRGGAVALPAIAVAVTLVAVSIAVAGPLPARPLLDGPSRLDGGGPPAATGERLPVPAATPDTDPAWPSAIVGTAATGPSPIVDGHDSSGPGVRGTDGPPDVRATADDRPLDRPRTGHDEPAQEADEATSARVQERTGDGTRVGRATDGTPGDADRPTFGNDQANTGDTPDASGLPGAAAPDWNASVDGWTPSTVLLADTASVAPTEGLFAVDADDGTVTRPRSVSGDCDGSVCDATPMRTGTPVSTPTSASRATPTPSGSAAAPDGSVPGSASTGVRDLTPSPTTHVPDDGLGTALAYAAILLLTGLGLLAAVVAGLALAIGRLLTDWFEQWETATLAAAFVSGLYAAVRGFTIDLSGGGGYYLGTYAALGAAGLLIAWLLGRALVWSLRWWRTDGSTERDATRSGADASESDPGAERSASGEPGNLPDE